MIIWGYKGYQKELGHTQSVIQCGNMSTNRSLGHYRDGSKFSLSLDSSHSLWKKYYVLCPVCQRGKEIEKQDINEYLNY